jgi:hypothetical protein
MTFKRVRYEEGYDRNKAVVGEDHTELPRPWDTVWPLVPFSWGTWREDGRRPRFGDPLEGNDILALNRFGDQY